MSNLANTNPGDGKEKKILLLPGPSKPFPLQISKTEPDVGGEGYRVLLFNDELHDMLEVVMQIVKAVQCTVQEATEIMLRAHKKGQAVVTITDRTEADRIAGVLREIALVVRVDEI